MCPRPYLESFSTLSLQSYTQIAALKLMRAVNVTNWGVTHEDRVPAHAMLRDARVCPVLIGYRVQPTKWDLTYHVKPQRTTE